MTSTSISGSACSARGCAEWGFFLADSWRVAAERHPQLRPALRAAAAVPRANNSYSIATPRRYLRTVGRQRQWRLQCVPAGRHARAEGRLPSVRQGRQRLQHRQEQLRAQPRRRLELGGGPLGSILGREQGDSVLRGGYTLAYDRPGMSDFATAIDDNPGISQTANRNYPLGNLGTPGTILLRNPADLGPPSFQTTRVYPMTDVVTGDIMTFEPESPGTVLADLDRRLAAQADERPRVRGEICRNAVARELADLQLQRGQYRRERFPRRVPRGAAEPAGEYRR